MIFSKYRTFTVLGFLVLARASDFSGPINYLKGCTSSQGIKQVASTSCVNNVVGLLQNIITDPSAFSTAQNEGLFASCSGGASGLGCLGDFSYALEQYIPASSLQPGTRILCLSALAHQHIDNPAKTPKLFLSDMIQKYVEGVSINV